MKARSLAVLAGLSGAGKSTALKAFEDQGYKCVDNLPAVLLKGFTEHLVTGASEIVQDFALLLDFTEPDALVEFETCIKKLRSKGVKVVILFFDAQDEVLIRRFRETRRPHPLIKANASAQTVSEAVHKERELYANVRYLADRVIDTSAYSPPELRKIVEEFVGKHSSMRVYFTSFGFKFGILQDADLVVDVRFLSNPYYVSELKEKTGDLPEVRDYVFKSGEANEFIERYTEILNFLLPKFKKEGKQYLTIGVGCTGGKHRSVAVCEALNKSVSDLLASQGVYTFMVQHRDINR